MMSLIPADQYYGKDNTDQWKRKKQTKEEKRQAKRAKLDPSTPTSALDVHREKERKRKREEEEAADHEVESLEKPREGMKPKQAKKQKVVDDDKATGQDAAEKRRLKRQEKQARKQAKKQKQQENKKAKKQEQAQKTAPKKTARPKNGKSTDNQDGNEDEELNDGDKGEDENEDGDEDVEEAGADELENIDFSNLNDDEDVSDNDSQASSSRHSPTFDAQHSSASSSSSIVPPAASPDKKASVQPAQRPDLKVETPTPAVAAEDDGVEANDASSTSSPRQKQKPAFTLPNVDASILQARLAARIEALRASRKADGIDGKPAKNRQELIENRRRKEEQRRAHKKELRAKARVTKDAEEEAARLRGGSGSPLWTPPVASPRTEANHFEFGRIAFDDGAEMDAALSRVVDQPKKKGPQDTKTALAAAQKKADRLKQFDGEKRADLQDKDRWLAARKKVHGEKLKDDTNLLKKTLKREEKQKSKSENSWNERIEGVRSAKEAKQKKRETNLQKRRDMKGVRGKAAKKLTVKKKRPGFEGSFKSGGSRRA